MAKPRPSLDDIFYRFMMDNEILNSGIGAESERMLRRLVHFSAAGRVWTYSPPGSGGLPDDDKKLQRLAGGNRYLWKRYRDEILQFFELKDGEYFLARDWVFIKGEKR